ncbi:dTDP-4-dehydrorhamnose reductase [Alkaliphilus metalliredigens QYMF]|uniref:dTDP-4-dehydrorhamnose reductase n=1 Tax=Alkaliphilus metalliredigens (strain QYMF) TaxID=293826 RepID=A6TQY7_ALKMQ|nr:NAD(P)-dependent oxidoreductase [Alkaliphilus metalliredigens]ABR48605.1 dTDP-4-dehydrorhamnose reductase [Alkaliphilus metalliredigens QYMF]
MKVCIVGGKGTLGHELTAQLKVLSPFKTYLLEIENVDIESFERVNKTLKEIVPGVVIYAAEFNDVEACELRSDDAFIVNAHGAGMVASICAGIGAKMVYISSDFVFSGEKSSSYNEKDPPKPINIYGWSKYFGEHEVEKNLQKHFIIRTARIFGERQTSFINTVLNLPTSNSIFKVIGDQRGSCTYTKDLALGINRLLSENSIKKYGIYHFVNSGSCTWYEMALKICKIKNLNIRLENVSAAQLNKKALYPTNLTLANHSPFQFRPWEEALEEYILKR